MEKLIKLEVDVEREVREIEKIEKEVLSLEKEYLKKFINIAIKGLKFEKIEEDITEYHGDDGVGVEIYYFEDEEGKTMEGIQLRTIEISFTKPMGENCVQNNQLYLMKNGALVVFFYEKKWRDDKLKSSTARRAISTKQEITEFDVDDIISEIEHQLKSSLGDRKKSQISRLEKFKSALILV